MKKYIKPEAKVIMIDATALICQSPNYEPIDFDTDNPVEDNDE